MPCGRQHLKLVRLPISPPPHGGEPIEYIKGSSSKSAQGNTSSAALRRRRLRIWFAAGRRWLLLSRRGSRLRGKWLGDRRRARDRGRRRRPHLGPQTLFGVVTPVFAVEVDEYRGIGNGQPGFENQDVDQSSGLIHVANQLFMGF